MEDLRDKLNEIMRNAVAEDIRIAIWSLLETKYLYQTVKVRWETVASKAKSTQDKFNGKNEILEIGPDRIWSDSLAAYLVKLAAKTQVGAWNVIPELHPEGTTLGKSDEFEVIAPPAELYCRTCKTSKAHNSGSLKAGIIPQPYPTDVKKGHQVFTCGYECQRCRSALVVYQITRHEEKLILSGCSEYPKISVLREIPEDVAEYVSEAKIAHGTGRTLAGLFFLRTAIEQHLRKTTGFFGRQTGEELVTAYRGYLNEDFPNKEWVLGRLYEELSAKLHMAEADEKQFEKTLCELERYFKALSLFPLVRLQPKASKDITP